MMFSKMHVMLVSAILVLMTSTVLVALKDVKRAEKVESANITCIAFKQEPEAQFREMDSINIASREGTGFHSSKCSKIVFRGLQSSNASTKALIDYTPEVDGVWCDSNLERQREEMCECVDYIEENSKRSLWTRETQITEELAKGFLESLLKRAKKKASLQEECCYEGCQVDEIYNHCVDHYDASIFDKV